jgi:hypothetical protein
LYSTCIFCHTSLGSNEAVEHFPVGRRLAFDAAKGRLWVVCRSCERWNLTPVEERWEAIEECERLFRDTKLRVSTDNIGLARVKEGTTLVRVGEPQRPEMAAWRYGDQFHHRRTKHFLIGLGGVAALSGLYVLPEMLGVAAAIGTIPGSMALGRWMGAEIARVPRGDDSLKLNRFMLADVRLYANEAQGFALEVPHLPDLPTRTDADGWFGRRVLMVNTPPTALFHGTQALRAARHLLPRINRSGARSGGIAEAVRVLEQSRGAEQLFGQTAFAHRGMKISEMPASLRLALEMSLHEDDERRAFEGELAELEDRWREAEEIAAIADDMFLPSGVKAMLKRFKGKQPKVG